MAQADWKENVWNAWKDLGTPPRMPRLAWQLNFEWCAYSWAARMPEIFVIGRLSLARYSLSMRMTSQLGAGIPIRQPCTRYE